MAGCDNALKTRKKLISPDGIIHGVTDYGSMTDIRIENEVKLISAGGPFAFTAEDSAKAVSYMRGMVAGAGITAGEPRFHRITDDYYTDTKDYLKSQGITIRYRVRDGWKHTITFKQPYFQTGMGLSRREIETELFPTDTFDRMAAFYDHLDKYLGEDVVLDPIPKVSDDILRMRFDLSSEVRKYTLSFDKIVYRDQRSGKRTLPGYELEIESMDVPIAEDRSLKKLINMLTDTGLFREERVSKYARGRSWVDSLSG